MYTRWPTQSNNIKSRSMYAANAEETARTYKLRDIGQPYTYTYKKACQFQIVTILQQSKCVCWGTNIICAIIWNWHTNQVINY